MHGADNNAVAHDTSIGPPERIQWVAGPTWSRDHDVTPSLFAPVSAKGRLFYVVEEGPVSVVDARLPDRYSVVARDAFNGIVLWKRPIDTWYSTEVIWGHIPVHSQRRLVAVGDRSIRYAECDMDKLQALRSIVQAQVGTVNTRVYAYNGGRSS